MATAPIALLEALDGASVAGADALACADWLRASKKLRGWLDAFDAQVTARLDELAHSGESFGSEHAHVQHGGLSAKDAARLRERAQTLGAAAGFADALAGGAVTAGHVDQLAAAAAHVGDDVRAALFDRAGELLVHAQQHDAGRFGRHCRDVARSLERDAGIERDRQQRRDTFLACTINARTGMYDVRGALHPELGNRLKRALDHEVAARVAAGEAAGVPEFVQRAVNRARLAAEALVDFATAGHQVARPIVADVGVLIDANTLVSGETHDHTVCETSEGALLSVTSVRRLLCNGLLTPIILRTDGTPLDVGRTSRTANRQQRRALRAMYRTCAAEGCDAPFDQCEIHHIVEWERLGLTNLDNMLPLCARHHHLVHELGWRLHLSADRTLTVTDRDDEILMQTTPDMPHRSRRSGQPPGRQPSQRCQPATVGGPAHEPTRIAS